MLTTRFHQSLDDIDANAWDALVADANPFVCHAFLAGMERYGCIRDEWGWRPHHLGLYDELGRLVAAAPLYFKNNSRGEYVFDFSWAHAFENAGGNYYPKLLCAIPYSPVTGPRLLVGNAHHADALRQALIAAMLTESARLGLSSAHVNFLAPTEAETFDDSWLARVDVQFHWRNQGYRDFEDFLATLKHKKRKNARHERAAVKAADIECAMHRGDALDGDDWQCVHQLYLDTFAQKGDLATLSLGFFRHLADSLGDGVQVALARRAGEIIAMALFLRGGDTLYGRYWGCRDDVPGLHFELCYYQGIDYAIAHHLQIFEPGAQGEHKLARGFLPVRTSSRHYIAHLGFRHAVAEALQHEAVAIRAYHDELLAHSPYRHP